MYFSYKSNGHVRCGFELRFYRQKTFFLSTVTFSREIWTTIVERVTDCSFFKIIVACVNPLGAIDPLRFYNKAILCFDRFYCDL